jgi:hypothetical protein
MMTDNNSMGPKASFIETAEFAETCEESAVCFRSIAERQNAELLDAFSHAARSSRGYNGLQPRG